MVGNGGSDLIYLPGSDKALADRIVEALSAQDYTSGIFVADALGRIPGTLPLSAIGLEGSARDAQARHRRQLPLLLDRLRRSHDLRRRRRRHRPEAGPGHARQLLARRHAQHHGRVAGPSFRQKFESTAPASNADLGKTIVRLMGLKAQDKGKLVGRVLAEALPNGGTMPLVQTGVLRSEPDARGNVTVLMTKRADQAVYFDAAGYPGRTLGLLSAKP